MASAIGRPWGGLVLSLAALGIGGYLLFGVMLAESSADQVDVSAVRSAAAAHDDPCEAGRAALELVLVSELAHTTRVLDDAGRDDAQRRIAGVRERFADACRARAASDPCMASVVEYALARADYDNVLCGDRGWTRGEQGCYKAARQAMAKRVGTCLASIERMIEDGR